MSTNEETLQEQIDWLQSCLDTRDDELDWAVNKLETEHDRATELEKEIEQWTNRAVEMTGNLANQMLENHDLREEQKLLKTRLAFLENGLEQLRKLFKPSGDNVKPVNAQEFVQTVYRRVVKTIGEAPSADPNYRLYVTPEQL